jgi:hypothetical protein
MTIVISKEEELADSSDYHYAHEKSMLKHLLLMAKYKNENITISAFKQLGTDHIGYDDFILKIESVKNGLYKNKYTKCQFSNMKNDRVYFRNTYVGKRFSIDVSGNREDLKYFMISERDYTPSLFDEKFPCSVSEATKNIEDSIEIKCHSTRINYLKSRVEGLSNYASTVNYKINSKKIFSIGNIFNDGHYIKYIISLKGNNCEVKMIMDLLDDDDFDILT